MGCQGLPGCITADEDSVVCLGPTEPLGRIQEIFGPVQAPLYALGYAGCMPMPETLIVGASVQAVQRLSTFMQTEQLHMQEVSHQLTTVAGSTAPGLHLRLGAAQCSANNIMLRVTFEQPSHVVSAVTSITFHAHVLHLCYSCCPAAAVPRHCQFCYSAEGSTGRMMPRTLRPSSQTTRRKPNTGEPLQHRERSRACHPCLLAEAAIQQEAARVAVGEVPDQAEADKGAGWARGRGKGHRLDSDQVQCLACKRRNRFRSPQCKMEYALA